MQRQISIPIANEAETDRLAVRCAQAMRPGHVVLLDGALAAGKTTFCRALIAALGSTDSVTSPTYAIANIYDAPDFQILHVDAYRLENAREFYNLGLEDYVENAVCLIEWGSRVRENFDAPLCVAIGFGDSDDARVFTLSGEDTVWGDIFDKLEAPTP